MENLVFVLWMILFPASDSLLRIMGHKVGYPREVYSDGVKAAGNFAMIVIWFYVGSLLYKG